MSVNRLPIRLPIKVDYNSDTHKTEVMGNESIKAEAFFYETNESLEEYSSLLNTVFAVFALGTYSIQIQTDAWYAEGVIEIG